MGREDRPEEGGHIVEGDGISWGTWEELYEAMTVAARLESLDMMLCKPTVCSGGSWMSMAMRMWSERVNAT